ncbi:MAG: hypothetical protein K5799_14960 [Erythrobacter sp.]|nr:hypothetical protein [Erythrobacter sp.]
MKSAATASHRQASAVLQAKNLHKVVPAALDAPAIAIGRGCSDEVKTYIEDFLKSKGWASPVEVAPGFDVSLNLMASKVVLHVQTGNMVRAFYDLMKMQALHQQNRADCGVLIVPTAAAARRMGSNLAQFERVRNELEGVFFHQITIPVLIAAFE